MIDRFNGEIKLIQNARVKNLVLQCLEGAPKYFWIISSSSTGIHHPKDEHCEGGQVVHNKKATKIGNYLCETLSITGLEKDCVIAACIMYDLCKHGYPDDKGYTVDGHGYLWTELARNVMTKNDFLDSDAYRTISRLIMYHMGKYDLPYILDWSDKLACIVHISDFLSSRDDIIVDIGGLSEVSIDKERKNQNAAECQIAKA